MAWYCHKRHANQYNRQEGPGTNLPNASHLTFDKDIKNGYWKKRQAIKLMVLGKFDILKKKKKDTRSILSNSVQKSSQNE